MPNTGSSSSVVPSSPAGPLAGITVVDLTRVLAGPYATMMLADLGARVIKIEQPGTGDDARAFGPFFGARSGYFTSLNRGKQSIALDLKAPGDRAIFEALLARADVLCENFRAGTMRRLGYDWPTLHERYPRLIYAATSGFGQTGPYSDRPAYDMVVQAMSGMMSITGHAGGPPTRVGTSIGDLGAALFTAVGIVTALYHRATTGETQMLDVAMLDGQIALLENAIARYYATGTSPGPLGARHPSIAPFGAFATADGYIVIACGNNDLFVKLCRIIDRPDLESDVRFVTNDARCEHVDMLTAEIEAALRTNSSEHWLTALTAAGVPASPLNDVATALVDPQVIARNMVVDLDDPTTPGLRVAGNPIKLSAFTDPTSRPAAPELDADRRTILDELGFE